MRAPTIIIGLLRSRARWKESVVAETPPVLLLRGPVKRTPTASSSRTALSSVQVKSAGVHGPRVKEVFGSGIDRARELVWWKERSEQTDSMNVTLLIPEEVLDKKFLLSPPLPLFCSSLLPPPARQALERPLRGVTVRAALL